MGKTASAVISWFELQMNSVCTYTSTCWGETVFEVTWGEFLLFLSYWLWTYLSTAIRDYSRSPLIFVCEYFGQEVISRTSVPFGTSVNKTQCRICKRLAGPFLCLSWSSLVIYFCWLEKGCSCFVQFCLSLLVWSVCKKGFGTAFGMALITWTQ